MKGMCAIFRLCSYASHKNTQILFKCCLLAGLHLETAVEALKFRRYMLLLLLKLLQSCLTLWDPIDGSPPGSPVPGILQARTLEWVAISFSNAWKWKVKVKSLSHVRLLVTPWTAAHQAPPSMGFSRQEYWIGVSLPSLSRYIEPSVGRSLVLLWLMQCPISLTLPWWQPEKERHPCWFQPLQSVSCSSQWLATLTNKSHKRNSRT